MEVASLMHKTTAFIKKCKISIKPLKAFESSVFEVAIHFSNAFMLVQSHYNLNMSWIILHIHGDLLSVGDARSHITIMNWQFRIKVTLQNYLWVFCVVLHDELHLHFIFELVNNQYDSQDNGILTCIIHTTLTKIYNWSWSSPLRSRTYLLLIICDNGIVVRWLLLHVPNLIELCAMVVHFWR